MDDRALAAALAAGGSAGLDGTYRAYADRLYAFCLALVPDPEPAADAVHDSFVLATLRARQLRDPDRFRPWLYAIARNECRRRLAGRDRPAEAPSEPVPAAAARLDLADREVFELGVRHGLSAHEVAAVLGLRSATARARLGAARDRVAALLRSQVDPDAAVAGYAAAPLPTAPPLLRARLEVNCFDPGVELERDAILRRAGQFDRETGFPRPMEARRRRRLVTASAAAAAAVVIVAGVAALTAPDILATNLAGEAPAGTGPSPQHSAGAPTTGAATGQTATAAGTPAAPASPVPAVPPRTPDATPSLSPTPPAAATPTAGPPLAVDATVQVDCVLGGWLGYRLQVAVTASEPLDTAVLLVAAGAESDTFDLDVDGTEADGRSSRMSAGEVEWWVVVTGTGGDEADTAPVSLGPECG